MYFDNMVLYYKPTCPFCHKVLAFMEQEDIAMPMRDTLEPGVKDDLIRIAGKGQVPCLIVDGVPMFESDDIVRFLGDLILEREEGSAPLQQTKRRTRRGPSRRVLFYGRLPQR